MSDKELNEPITKKYLLDYTQQIVLPAIGEMLDEKLRKNLDEILTSDDKLSKKLDKVLTEQQAITAGFKRLQDRVNYLEAVVKVLAEKEGLKFTPPEL